MTTHLRQGPEGQARHPCIAIDGPVGAGKSTIAKLVARELGYTYVDSGAMYRALAWAAQTQGIPPHEQAQVAEFVRNTTIELRPRPDGVNEVVVNGRDVTREIRMPEIGQLASRLSAMTPVRRRMVTLQQQMARAGGVVMEGRDIQTVVLPDAEVKIFLTAPAEERARRRWLELRGRGVEADLNQVLAEVQARDERDSTRADSPLQPAPDAVHVDAGGRTIEQVVARVLAIVREACPNA
jgi:cytidylate kinase